ncbi:hypothetical protein [Alicyclobacillus tolerans]|uniref:DNA-directed RNA polymerase subunit L n=1 Tax=Alicyclobacillus tolerans TaxID=90970 RepID=A0ABT9LUH0_9BACL|nr:hypothetical protein [Alicyclobacillus tengchongensis]MDP9727915.1 DNA-directed RNA polymerase subunit L [Alicyclobacillus tengchongensis]
MQKRIWGLTASMLALTCLTVTGCGINSGAANSLQYKSIHSPQTIKTTSQVKITSNKTRKTYTDTISKYNKTHFQTLRNSISQAKNVETAHLQLKHNLMTIHNNQSTIATSVTIQNSSQPYVTVPIPAKRKWFYLYINITPNTYKHFVSQFGRNIFESNYPEWGEPISSVPKKGVYRPLRINNLSSRYKLFTPSKQSPYTAWDTPIGDIMVLPAKKGYYEIIFSGIVNSDIHIINNKTNSPALYIVNRSLAGSGIETFIVKSRVMYKEALSGGGLMNNEIIHVYHFEIKPS